MHDPEQYEKLNVRRGDRDLTAELLSPIFNKMGILHGRNQKILDFGCGTGIFALKYLIPIAEETDSKIIGIDVSKEMIEYATSRNTNERLTYVLGDIMNDDFVFGGTNFDHIISFFVLHFIKDYKTALKRLFNLLKPGGQCGLVISAKHNQFVSYKLLGQDPKWSQYFEGYDKFCPDWTYCADVGESAKRMIDTAAEEVGFKIIDSVLKDIVFTADAYNLHTKFLLTLNPLILNVPKGLQEDLHTSLNTLLCQFYGFPNTEEFYSKPFTDTNYQTLSVVLQKPL